MSIASNKRPTMLMDHGKTDPKKAIMDGVGDLSEIELFGNQVLLGVYERPETTASGIKLPDSFRAEDSHQGKACLVLKKGPNAFVSDENYNFGDQNVEPGEWVALWVSDGRKVKIRGTLCRVVYDQHIRMKVPSPDVIY